MFIRSQLWSLLQTQWLDVPIEEGVGYAHLTWGGFSEIFEACLQGVYRHVDRRVKDRSSLEGVVTAVFVENLHVLVSPLGEQAKLGLLLAAADRLIVRTAASPPSQS
jgi:hypothetical protein